MHGKTISKIGRKNAIVIGLGVAALANAGMAVTGLIESSSPKTFIGTVIVLRILMGYGDSLAQTTIFSVVSQLYTDDLAAKLGYLRLAVGLGGMVGPICCDLTYQYTNFIVTFGMCTVLLLASLALCQTFLPEELNGDSVGTVSPGRSSDNNSSVAEQDADEPASATSDVNMLREEEIGVMILFSDSVCLQGLY